VNAAATGANNGTSWADAYTSLDSALAAAANGDSIWVVQGRYKPSSGTTGFNVSTQVGIYGGFNGTETDVQHRLGSYANTILDADIGTVGDPSDNAHHVVSISNVGNSVTIDGFSIINGNSSTVNGGGIYLSGSTLNLANCFIHDNRAVEGGAVYATSHFGSENSSTSPTPSGPSSLNVKWCEFYSNSADKGGALFGIFSVANIVNSYFHENSADTAGGVVYLVNMDVGTVFQFTNCILWSNTSDVGAVARMVGGASVDGGRSSWTNCTFNLNSATTSGGAISVGSTSDGNPPSSTATNCIFWGDSATTDAELSGTNTVTYSDVDGGHSGTGNINSDPLFINSGMARLGLQSGSPCRDAASYTALPADALDIDDNSNTTEIIPWDFAGNKRWVDDLSTTNTGTGTYTYLDMGAIEAQGS
jgi:predicted outer membrane repeat protein